jgi:nitroreductase
MQPWEFCWVRSPDKKAKLVEACLSQSAAKTAAELVVAIARVDTWRRNQKAMLETLSANPKTPKMAHDYYRKVVPLMYFQDPLNLVALLKWAVFTTIGFFKPVPRGPLTRAARFEVVTKTTALACENLMLAVSAQGYASCPMEGFDERRVKKLLGLNRHVHVVMVIGIGEPAPDGIFGPQIRFDQKLFVKEI